MPADKRLIVISDIHGNLELFQSLLEKVSYSQNDILILVGDLIEKGYQSLDTLRYIMKLSKTHIVHAVSGNCDTLWEDIKYGDDDSALLKYMLARKNSILNEMCEEIGIEVNEKADIKEIKDQILVNFKGELEWLEQLPHIIETKSFIFVHAGVTSENLEEQAARKVMKNDAFMEKGIRLSKYLIVGHWPVINYGKEKGCCNPIVNHKQKIISIDGGNAIKRDGQLNAVIIINNDVSDISYASVDDLSRGVIIENQNENSKTIHISWNDNAVEIIEEKAEFSLCRHKSTKHELWIKNTRLFKDKDEVRSYDCTDYFLDVKKGDIVSIIEKASRQTLVKKDGTIGWVLNEKLQI